MKKCYLYISAILLFNPILSVIDIFPDFIGYLLLFLFFHKMSYVDEKTEDLCSSLRLLTITSFARFVSLFAMPSLDDTMYLVFSFVFAILETIFGILMITKLFDMFSNYALLNKNEACANNYQIKKLTIISLIVKLALATLPDFTFLAISNGVDTQTNDSILRFRPLLFILSALASLVVGTIWLVKMVIYYKKLFSNDTLTLIKNEFQKKSNGKEAVFMSKDNMFFVMLMSVLSVFIIDFNLNLVNVFPDSIFSIGITVCLVIMTLKKYFNGGVLQLIIIGSLSVIHAAVDVFLTILSFKYFEKYNLESMIKSSEAEDMYFTISIVSSISAVLMVSVVSLALLVIIKNSEVVLRDNAKLFTAANTEALIEDYRMKTKKRYLVVFICTIISAIIYCCYIYFRYYVPSLTLFSTISELVFVFAFVSTMLYLYDNVYKRILIHSK